jgi:deazaflavin-dependent oxidoreductase (nitroreductase family)
VDLYRLTHGFAAAPGYPTLLLTTRGRRTGRERTVPLVYVRDGEAYAVCAAYAGSDRHPAWWLNLAADPHGVVQVGGSRQEVVAEPVPDDRRVEVWQRLVAMYPPFEAYRGRTTRRFPVVLLRPVD